MNHVWWADKDNQRIWLGMAVVAGVSYWIWPWLLLIEAAPFVALFIWLGFFVKGAPWYA
ncbi:hypothetical protein [Bradyrhizobium sp. Ai1a-2]|uniref:hypothetical protein n=1 Tax=Bradyrhizobium sp. Ai1a-2 TaxID=196490 RepID=UPI00041E77C8|nr:hypothetical protein [Bradyrhizobium sp. Ai1a-2]